MDEKSWLLFHWQSTSIHKVCLMFLIFEFFISKTQSLKLSKHFDGKTGSLESLIFDKFEIIIENQRDNIIYSYPKLCAFISKFHLIASLVLPFMCNKENNHKNMYLLL